MSFNERVQFYLKHRDQLEEWLAVRDEAAAAIDAWLTGLRGDVQALASDLGGDVGVIETPEDFRWPGFFLKRAAWPGTRLDSDFLVGIEWQRGRTLLGAESAPFVGIRSQRSKASSQALRADAQFQEVRLTRKDKSIPWWPAQRYVPTDGALAADHAERYRRTLLDELRAVWTVYVSIVDRIVRG
jgi:hypothetical protein